GGVAGGLALIPFVVGGWWWFCSPILLFLAVVFGALCGAVGGVPGGAVGTAWRAPVLGAALGGVLGLAAAGGPPLWAFGVLELRSDLARWEREKQSRTSPEGQAEATAQLSGLHRQFQEDGTFCLVVGLVGLVAGGVGAWAGACRALGLPISPSDPEPQ